MQIEKYSRRDKAVDLDELRRFTKLAGEVEAELKEVAECALTRDCRGAPNSRAVRFLPRFARRRSLNCNVIRFEHIGTQMYTLRREAHQMELRKESFA